MTTAKKTIRIEIRVVGRSGETIKALSEEVPLSFPLESLLAAGEQLRGICRWGTLRYEITPSAQ